MASRKTIAVLMAGSFFMAVSVVAVAQTTSKSPFASKKPKAWETRAPTPGTSVPAAPWAPSYTPSYTPPANVRAPSLPTRPAISPYESVPQPHGAQNANKMAGGQYYPGKTPSQPAQPSYQPPQYQQGVQGAQGGAYQGPTNYPQAAGGQYTGGRGQAPNLRGPAKPSWASRFGLGNLETSLEGTAMVGIAAVDTTGGNVDEEIVADIDLRGEVSAITSGGLEYGVGARLRAQLDPTRRGFGGRIGGCPAVNPACSSVLVGADQRAVKGHTSQFYTDGLNDSDDTRIALEGAYIFLRSSYGDLLLGRDDGSAYLFSLGAPTLVAVNASNSKIDYTGLDSVKTFNDASGFATKIAYTSPRLLGDQIGFGVQFGASYAPNARACGVDYCVKKNTTDPLDPFAPEIEDVFEVGIAFDRKFDNGFSAELTGTYARGSEKSGRATFDDLQSYGAGLELKYADLVFGTSYLKSNNGFAGDGDYTAYDAGLTWQPNNWGFTASYGHAKDDIVKLKSDQGVLAVSYDFGKFRLGSGVQYVHRTVPGVTAGAVDERTENATALFLEGRFKF